MFSDQSDFFAFLFFVFFVCILREEACTSLQLITDNDNTTVNIHQFSENIIINNPTGYNSNNLNCDPENVYFTLDQYFISLDEY